MFDLQSVSDKSASSKKMAILVGEESDGNESSSEPTDDDRTPSTLRMTTNEEEDLGKVTTDIVSLCDAACDSHGAGGPVVYGTTSLGHSINL